MSFRCKKNHVFTSIQIFYSNITVIESPTTFCTVKTKRINYILLQGSNIPLEFISTKRPVVLLSYIKYEIYILTTDNKIVQFSMFLIKEIFMI